MRRRTIAIISIVTVGFMLILFLVSPRSPDSASLTVVGFGGTYQDLQRKELFQPFADQDNVSINDVSYAGDYGQLATDIAAGRSTWDIVQVESSFLLRGAERNLLEPIDYDAIGDPQLVSGARHKYGVAHIGWANVLCWNNERLPDGVPPPSHWRDLWDFERYPGLRGLRKTPRGNLEVALLADGVPPSEIYPLDIDRAIRKLTLLKEHIDWWSSGAESQQKLLNADTLGVLWNGRVWALKQDGHAVDYTLNAAVIDYDWWVIPKGRLSHQERLIWSFLDFACQPTVQATISTEYGYSPTVSEALSLLPNKLLEEMPTTSPNLQQGVLFDSKWWAENEVEVAQHWNRWLLE